MLHAIQTLIAAIDAGVVGAEEWQAWAEREILAQSTSSSWLADLITTSDPSNALAALHEGWRRYRGNDPGTDTTSLLIGFLYDRHLSGGAPLLQTLERIGDVVDGRNYSDPACETVYALVNALEVACGYEPMAREVADKAEAVLGPHLDVARTARKLLSAGPN